MLNRHNFNSKKPFLISFLLFFLFFFLYLNIYKSFPLHYDDENHWIGRGYYFELFITRDFKNELWEDYFAYDQPKIGNYYYALLFYPQYLKEKEIHGNTYDFSKYLIDHNFYRSKLPKYELYKENNPNFIKWSYDYTQGYLANSKFLNRFGPHIQKTVDMVYKARFMNTILLSFTVVIAYLLTLLMSKNILISFITAIMFGTNSLIIEYSLLAQTDGLFNFLFLLNIYLLLVLLKQIKMSQNYTLSLLTLSIALPLLTGTKINGIMLFFFTIMALFSFALYDVFHKKTRLYHIFISILTIIFIFINLFFAIDPYLYPNPIERTVYLFTHRKFESERQVIQRPDYYLPGAKERFFAIYNNFLLDQNKQCKYNNDYFSKNYCYINKNPFFVIKFFLSVAGLLLVIKNILDKKTISFLYILCAFIFIQIMLLIYLNLDRSRYYLQLVYFFVFFQAYGVWYIGLQIIKLANRLPNYRK